VEEDLVRFLERRLRRQPDSSAICRRKVTAVISPTNESFSGM
jgi:hypothetical protein